MTDDNSTLVDMDNLDTFSSSFFGSEDAPQEDKPAPAGDEDNEDVDTSDENGDDTAATEDDEDAHSEEEPDEDEDQEDEEETPKPKGKKSAKERIEELYAANKQKERELAELRAAVEALKVPKQEENAKPQAETAPVAVDEEAPSPDAVDKDGNPIYKLGEFDPTFIRDLTRYTIAQETKAAREAEARENEQKALAHAQNELQNAWTEKVAEAEKEIPELRDALGTVGQAFAGIDPNYGEYLAASIMSCDHGPEIMYYFSQNIGEAQKIVASGPAAAALAIGRLDAKFTKPAKEEKRNTKKQSDAPAPPEARNRGSSGKFSTSPDTPDLNAFEKEFFGKK